MIIGDMEIRLRADYARLQRDLDQARGVLGTAVGHFERMATAAKTALGAISLGLSATAFAGWIKGAIDAADATDELSEKTGVLAEDLAGLQLIFQREGIDNDAMTASLSRLSKGIVEGNNGLSALGIKAKDVNGEFRTTQAVLYDVADQFAGMENGVQKTALAVEIFGKSGASLIPMLNGGSQGMRDMAEMAQKLGLVIDEQTAKSAGDFNDTLFLLGQGSQGIARGLAAELLPTLTNLAGVFLQSMTEGDALVRTAAALSSGLKALYTVGAVVVETFKTAGTVIGSFAAVISNSLSGDIDRIVKIANGDFKGAWDSLKKTVTSSTGIYVDAARDIGSSWKSMGTNIAQAWDSDGNAAVLAAAKQVKAQKDLMGNQKQREEAEKKAAAAREAASNAADKFIETQAQEIAQVGLAADQLKMLAAARAASLAPTDEQRKKIMEQALALDIATKAQNEKTEAEKAALAATAKADEALYAATAGVWDQVAAMEKQVELYGLTEDQVLRLQRTKLQADLAAADGDEKKIAALTLQIQGTERLIALSGGLAEKKAATKLAEDMLAEQNKAVEKYNDIFSKGFADMLNNGKAGWSSFTKSLTTTFKTSVADQIYKMFAQPFVVKMVASLLGVTGTGFATAAQAAGSGTGLVGIAQTASNLYKAITGGLNGLTSTIGTGLANLGTMLSSSGLQGFGMGVQGAAGMSSEGAAYLAQNVPGFSAGAAAAPWLGAAAGYGIGSTLNSAISGQYQTGSGVQTVEKIATAVASYFGGPLGGAIAGAISGLVNRTFGMGAKTQTASGIYGELGPGGASVSTYSKWAQKGGLLRSDKSGIDTATADMDTVTSLGNTYKAIIGASREYAEALGVNAEFISSRSQIFDIQLGKDAAANEKAIGTFFGGVADAVAGELVPGLAKFSKEGEAASATLQRLATNYAGLDVVLSTIGLKFGAVGVDSIAARERLIELSGGLQQLSTNVQGFAQNYLTESERLAPVAKAVGDALAGLGLSGVDTRDEFKNVVLGLDLTTEAGAKQYAAMMQLQEAFAQVHPAVEATTSALRSAADIAQERASLQKQYDEALMSSSEKERAAIAASNIALYDALQVRLAEKAAIDAATQAAVDAAAARAATENGIQADIDALVKASLPLSEQRKLEVAGMADTTLALYERREALQAEAKAVADSKAAADALASTNAGYQQQIDAILKARMTEQQVRALETAGMQGSTLALYDRLAGLKAEDAALAASAKARAEADAAAKQNMQEYLSATAAAYQKQLADQDALASQYAAKETELFNLTHTEAEQLARARQLELDAMPATVAALQLQINAQKDLADAATKAANEIQAAAQKAAAIASERAGIQRDVLQLKGDTAGLRALELAALDPANRAAKQAYYDLQDKMAADQAASAAAQAWAQAQSNAAQSSIQAAEALKSAWKSATDSIFDEVARIRGLDSANGAQTYAGAQSAFAIATAQARAGDQEAAKLLPGLSKAMLDLAEANAVTAFDLRLARAQAAASLYQTGSMIGSQYGIKVPSYDVGTDYVSQTGFALIHEGEKITPAASNRPFTSSAGGMNDVVNVLNEVLAENKAIKAEIAELRRTNSNENYAIARNTGDAADKLDTWEAVGMPKERIEA